MLVYEPAVTLRQPAQLTKVLLINTAAGVTLKSLTHDNLPA